MNITVQVWDRAVRLTVLTPLFPFKWWNLTSNFANYGFLKLRFTSFQPNKISACCEYLGPWDRAERPIVTHVSGPSDEYAFCHFPAQQNVWFWWISRSRFCFKVESSMHVFCRRFCGMFFRIFISLTLTLCILLLFWHNFLQKSQRVVVLLILPNIQRTTLMVYISLVKSAVRWDFLLRNNLIDIIVWFGCRLLRVFFRLGIYPPYIHINTIVWSKSYDFAWNIDGSGRVCVPN